MTTRTASSLSVGVAALAGYIGLTELKENKERWKAYEAARQMADAVGKPLLNIGCPRIRPLRYPCGDMCLDIDPDRLKVCESPHPTLADIRAIPFSDNYFGAVLCSHVLEHLHSIEDARQAVAEMVRVSGSRVFVVSPSTTSIPAHLHAEHRLWIVAGQDGGLYAQRRLHTEAAS